MNTGNRNQELETKTAIFYITHKGLALADRLKGLYPDARILKFKSGSVSDLWGRCKNLIFIMAAGIVVRTIAPLIRDKRTDPAVVVLDEKGDFAISLLSGHLGGANEVSKEIADFLGGKAVITTASDVNDLTPIDLWAAANGLAIEDWDLAPQIGARLLNNGNLKVYTEIEVKLPEEFLRVAEPQAADILITNKACHPKLVSGSDWMLKQVQHDRNDISGKPFYLRPKNLVIGIGCNSATSEDEIENSIKAVLDENNLSFLSIHSIATIDIKGHEQGLKAFAEKHNLKISTFTADELNKVNGVSKSEAVFNATGAYAVSEPAALLASGAQYLLIPKQKKGNVTVAIAEIRATDRPHNSAVIGSNDIKNKLYIVGIGPGGIEHITPYAQKAIKNSDVIVGYGTYLDLIQELIKDKEVVSTGMTQEIDRCKKAVELAMSGKNVSVISGGDPGIYAMAGLVFDIYRGMASHAPVNIEVIPGISALNACAARLGAPLMHDFAVISLSDRLTPWKLIEKRIEAAAMSDFVTVFYNPKSIGRQEHIDKARAIFLKHRSIETPVGIVKGAMRENERVIITNLRDMLNHEIDMQTTVIIGNSQTFVWNNLMITPRGYERKLGKS